MPNKTHCIFSLIFFVALILFKDSYFSLFAGIRQLKEIQALEKPMPSGSPLEAIVKPSVEYDAGNLRDPFTNPFAKEEKQSSSQKVENQEQAIEFVPPALKVQGIIWGGKFPQAIINDKVVKVGDTIEGAQITDIKKEGITCLFQGRQFNVSSPALNLGPRKNFKER